MGWLYLYCSIFLQPHEQCSCKKSIMMTPGGIPAGAGTLEKVKFAKRILTYTKVSLIEVLEIPEQKTANFIIINSLKWIRCYFLSVYPLNYFLNNCLINHVLKI